MTGSSDQNNNISLYLLLRLVLLFSVLVSIVLFQRSGLLVEEEVVRTYFLSFFTFLVTAAFVFSYEKARLVSYFPASLVLYDILFTTALIHNAHGQESVYKNFYIFNIVFASLLFKGRGGLIAALVSAISYTAILVVHSTSFTDERYFSYLTTLTSFVAVALLSGQLVEELRKSRVKISSLEKLKDTIVDKLDSGLITVDRQNVITGINATGRNILCLDSDHELRGKPLGEVLSVKGEEMKHSKIHVIWINGRRRECLVTEIQLPEANKMILFRDLTDVLELEQRLRRQEKLASIGQLAAGLAHEIRNPMASISGAAQLLGQGDRIELDEMRKLTGMIVRETERVDRLIFGLLRFAKAPALGDARANVDRILTEVCDSLRARSDVKELGIQITTEYLADKSDGVDAAISEDELTIVLSNVLINAIEAFKGSRQESRRNIDIEVHHGVKFIEIHIRDNGPGILKENLARIFDPFFTTKSGGTGLGLAHVHKIVRDAGGLIDIDSRIGVGTEFKVQIPLRGSK